MTCLAWIASELGWAASFPKADIIPQKSQREERHGCWLGSGRDELPRMYLRDWVDASLGSKYPSQCSVVAVLVVEPRGNDFLVGRDDIVPALDKFVVARGVADYEMRVGKFELARLLIAIWPFPDGLADQGSVSHRSKLRGIRHRGRKSVGADQDEEVTFSVDVRVFREWFDEVVQADVVITSAVLAKIDRDLIRVHAFYGVEHLF